MAEPRRREDELYTDQANVRENDPETQNVNRPQLVNSAGAESSLRETETSRATSENISSPAPLFSTSDVEDLRMHWGKIQTGFVDEPRWAVKEADTLVATITERLAESFSNARSAMEKQWDRGDDVSTEELRLALQRYRTFFDRLLNI